MNRKEQVVAKFTKQHVLGLHGNRKGTIVAKFEKSHRVVSQKGGYERFVMVKQSFEEHELSPVY